MPCTVAHKMKPSTRAHSERPPALPGQHLHIDLRETSWGKSFITVDQATGFTMITPIESKQTEHVLEAIREMVALNFTVRGLVVETIRFDDEATLIALQRDLADDGIKTLHSAAGKHEATAERMIRTVNESVSAVFLDWEFEYGAPVPRAFKEYVVQSALSGLNDVPTTKSMAFAKEVGETVLMSPSELVTGKVSQRDRAPQGLRMGALVVAALGERPARSRDMGPRGEILLVVGISIATARYYGYRKATGTIVKRSFENASVLKAENVPPNVMQDFSDAIRALGGRRDMLRDGDDPALTWVTDVDTAEVTIGKALPLVMEKREVHPRVARFNGNWKEVLAMTAVARKEVLARIGPEGVHRIKMDEVKVWDAYGVVKPVMRHEQTWEQRVGIPLRTNWVFANKIADIFAARMVLDGSRQKPNAEAYYSPTVSMLCVMIMWALTALWGWQVVIVDVSRAFLQVDAPNPNITVRLEKEEADMFQSFSSDPGWSRRYSNGAIDVAVLKAAFGLKESPKAFHDAVVATLCADDRYELSKLDSCVFYRRDNRGEVVLIVNVHVDDFQVMYKPKSGADEEFIATMEARFGVLKKQRGPVFKHLGMAVTQKPDGSIHVNQNQYAQEMLDKFKKEKAPEYTPTPVTEKYAQRVDRGKQLNEPQAAVFTSQVAQLGWMVRTRPDLAHCHSLMAQAQKDPHEADADAVQRALDYLFHHPTESLTFRPGGSAEVYAMADAAYAREEGLKSRTGMFVGLWNTGVVAWESSTQSSVQTSSTAAELTAQHKATVAALKVQLFLKDIKKSGKDLSQVVMFQDNRAAIHRVEGNGNRPVSRSAKLNLDVKFNFLGELCNKEVRMVWIDSASMVADALTKQMPPYAHEKHFAGILDPGRLDPGLESSKGPAVPRGCVPGSFLESPEDQVEVLILAQAVGKGCRKD